MSTCQICGRLIQANTGLIAHHGYRRPYPQLQTRSCYGARRRPYEVAHDAIDEYLVILVEALANADDALATFRSSPPDHLTYTQKRDAWDRGTTVSVPRPSVFYPADPAGLYTPRSYANLYAQSLADRERLIRNLSADHRELVARRAAWKEAA